MLVDLWFGRIRAYDYARILLALLQRHHGHRAPGEELRRQDAHNMSLPNQTRQAICREAVSLRCQRSRSGMAAQSMTDNRTGQFVISTLCVLLLAGCGKKVSDEIDFGAVKNSVYHNKYFGFNLTLPSEWSVQDQEMSQRLAEIGRKTLAGEDKGIKALFKASEQQSINLLTAFKYPVGTPVPFNPMIACVAERVRELPGIKCGKDYHYHAKKLMESGQMKFEFPKEISAEKLGGIDFDVMHALMTIGPSTVQQKYYAAIMKGYALVFIVSFTTTDEESVLQSILEGVSFK
jgi:hypothetical protein